MVQAVAQAAQNRRRLFYSFLAPRELLASLLVAAVTIALFLCYAALLLRLPAGSPSRYPLVLLAVFIACLAASRVTYASVPASIVTLARGLAIATGLYSVTLFPGIPIVHDVFFGHSQPIIVLAWLAAGIASVFALWRPSWLIYCAFYTFWIKNAAGYVTGLKFHTLLDAQPLYQVPAYLGAAIVALQLLKRSKFGQAVHLGPTLRPSTLDPWILVFITAIALHAANYFYSGIAKASLNGVTDWAFNNENANLLLVALYNKQLLWGEWQALESAAVRLTTFMGRPLAVAILLGQLAALFVFSNRRLLILLFTFYDIMHIGIFVLSGANFWTWFMLNLAIITAAAKLPAGALDWKTGLFGAVLILASIKFADIAWLGWYDTRAINSVHFEVAYPGGRTRLPVTAFGFYSYPIAHMSFGLPPGNYFPTLTNGGATSAKIYRQAATCAFESTHSRFERKWDPDAVTGFIRGYHRYMLEGSDGDGRWSDDFYPHHFWAAPSVVRDFASVDMRKVTDYILVVDSACLDATGAVISAPYHNEFKIHVGQQ
jgi:hypothetical protein